MTGLDLYSAVGDVDEELLEESEHTKMRLKWRRALPFAASVACAALVAAVAVNMREEDIASKPSETSPATIGEITAYDTAAAGEYGETGFEMPTVPAGTASLLPEYTANTLTEIIVSDDIVEVICSITTAGDDSADDTVIFPAFTADTSNLTEAAVTVPPILTVEGYTPPPGRYTGGEDFTETTSAPGWVVTTHDLLTTVDLTDLSRMEEALIPRWEDMSDMERFTGLRWREAEYSITSEKFDSSELEFMPADGRLFGYDAYTDSEISMPIGVYRIRGINENYMAAVLTADGKYTGFRNLRYAPADLEKYLGDIDFYNRHMPQRLYSGDVISASEHMEYTLPDLPERVEHLLAMRRYTPPEINPPMDRGLSIYALEDGKGNYVMSIYENGYIFVLGKFFKVGEEVTGEFIEYAEANAVKSELMPYGNGASGESVPE